MKDFTLELIKNLFFPLVVGVVLWVIGNRAEKRKLKAEAIRDLMTHRGDYASGEFRKSLNKVAIVFHDKPEIRSQVRGLYDTINDQRSNSEKTKRAIVGLIYKLCQTNHFRGLTEYDIDQSFLESKQTPEPSNDDLVTPVVSPIVLNEPVAASK